MRVPLPLPGPQLVRNPRALLPQLLRRLLEALLLPLEAPVLLDLLATVLFQSRLRLHNVGVLLGEAALDLRTAEHAACIAAQLARQAAAFFATLLMLVPCVRVHHPPGFELKLGLRLRSWSRGRRLGRWRDVKSRVRAELRLLFNAVRTGR